MQTKRDGVEMEVCPLCQGMWVTRQELNALEDEVFDFGETTCCPFGLQQSQ